MSWICDTCGVRIENVEEEYGDYAGPDYPGYVVIVKRRFLRHPRNGCVFENVKFRLAEARR